MIEASACASKLEIGALFDEFLGLDHIIPDNAVCGGYTIKSATPIPTSTLPLMLKSEPPTVPVPASPMSDAASEDASEDSSPSTARPKRKSPQAAVTKATTKRAKKEDQEATGDDPELCKKARRRKQNRVAAQTSREKKKKYLSGLEQKVQELTDQNAALLAKLKEAQEENLRLRENKWDGDEVQPSLAVEPSLSNTKQPSGVKLEEFSYIGDLKPPSATKKQAIIFESAVFALPQQTEMMALSLVLQVQFLLQLMAVLPWILLKLTQQSRQPSLPSCDFPPSAKSNPTHSVNPLDPICSPLSPIAHRMPILPFHQDTRRHQTCS